MRKSFLLARSQLRGAKGQAAAIVVLMFLAAFMLNLWLMLLTDYKQNFDRCHDRLHAEHVVFAADEDSEEMRQLLTQTTKRDKRTDEVFLDEAMHMIGVFEYNGGEVTTELVILNRKTAALRRIGKVEILEEGDVKSGVYMPILYKSEDTAIGKTVTITIGSKKMEYPVCGFFNSVMAGSHNCNMCQLLLTEDAYETLRQDGGVPKATLCSVRIKEKEDSEAYESMLKNAISLKKPGVRTVSNSYALVSASRYISQMICSGILSAMAFFILLIALVVMASNILNYIQENMKNLGVLKASGYTGRQLFYSLLLQFLGISMGSLAAGIAASYLVFPYLNDMMVSQTGIPYEIRFLPLPFFASLMILGGAVWFVVWLSSRHMRKTEPIMALRQGIFTHNFKRNHVPLTQTKLQVSFALALKTTLSGVKYNVTVCITMLVLSLVVVFSGVMVRNAIADTTPFLDLIAGETADSCIDVNERIEEDFLQKIKKDKRVEKAYLYSSTEVRHVGGIGLVMTICDDFSKVNNRSVVFEGRFPKYDNELAVAAKYAKERGIEIGQEMTITANGKEAAYLVTGFTQLSNHLGKDCLMTREGYERLGKLQNVSYYLNISEQTDIDAFHADIKRAFAQDVNAAINIQDVLKSSASVYTSLMTVIVAAILLISVVVIAFVLFFLVRIMLGNKKREYGILKACGFTSGQLILQTALSFLPAMAVSTVVGLIVSSMVINPLIALFLGSIGVVKCTFIVPVGFVAAAGAGLLLLAFLIACPLSLKIKEIAPKELIAGE